EVPAADEPAPVGRLISPAGARHADGIEPAPPPPAVVMLSGRVFVGACAIAALAVVAAGRISPTPVGLLAAEVLATILGMFVLGSFKYQIHKNALTYGMLLVIAATFY